MAGLIISNAWLQRAGVGHLKPVFQAADPMAIAVGHHGIHCEGPLFLPTGIEDARSQMSLKSSSRDHELIPGCIYDL